MSPTQLCRSTDRAKAFPLLHSFFFVCASVISVFSIICVSLGCFTDEVEYPYADQIYLSVGAVSELRVKFCANLTV